MGIINYGMGNLQSVKNACDAIGVQCEVLNELPHLDSFTHYILPGVGSFNDGMVNLNKLGWKTFLKQVAHNNQQYLLGICLGMQLLADEGVEGGLINGLGIIRGKVKRFELEKERVPHVGWNEVKIRRANNLIEQDNIDYYFVHSYHFEVEDESNILATSMYEKEFVSAVEKWKVFGVQFHPEKSHQFGLKLLNSFVSMK